ncbi:MAG: hypothetical protein H6581_04485 [Bacteroidia bacterium]|nr:hypothetical protein [Bacteroidia bacterium]
MAIKQIFFLSCLLLLWNCMAAQPSFEGKWYGTITQYPRGIDTLYEFGVNLEMIDGVLQGSTYIATRADLDWWGKMSFTGQENSGELELTEGEILVQQIPGYAYWCHKTLYLRLVQKGEKWVLEGYWESGECSRSAGTIHLERVNT